MLRFFTFLDTPSGRETPCVGEGGIVSKIIWFPDGRGIYFVGFGDAKDDVWHVSLGTGEEKPLTALTGRRGTMGESGVGTDGRYLYFTKVFKIPAYYYQDFWLLIG